MKRSKNVIVRWGETVSIDGVRKAKGSSSKSLLETANED